LSAPLPKKDLPVAPIGHHPRQMNSEQLVGVRGEFHQPEILGRIEKAITIFIESGLETGQNFY
jgi:hypothetical protein